MDMSLLNMIFNGLIVCAIAGLWVLWYQQAGQRKKVEQMLAQASSELQEATLLLEQVMQQLPNMKENITTAPAPDAFAEKAAQQAIQQTAQQDQVNIQAKSTARRKEKPRKTSKQSTSTGQSATIMRLKREGLTAEDIANQLDMPIAQVRLMLLLQAPKV